MTIFESQLISPSGEIITIQKNGNNINIPYYNIGLYLEKMVNEFISESEQNKDIFNLFQKDYDYFNPYFDFAIIYLGYKLKNPLLTEESILYGINDCLIIENSNKIIPIKKYLRVTDKNYNIDLVNIDNLKSGYMTPSGLNYEVNYDLQIGHERLSELILIEKIIYDKKLYDDYIYCMTNPNLQYAYPNIERYFRGRLGFIQYVIYDNQSGFIVYNEDLKDEYIENLFSSIRNMYPKINLDSKETLSSYLSKDEIKKAIEMKQEVGEIYESRRIRF